MSWLDGISGSEKGAMNEEKLRAVLLEMIERWEQAVASLNVKGFDPGQMVDAMDTYIVPNVLHYFWDDFKLYQNRVGKRLTRLEERLTRLEERLAD